jgi:hypothetical protein
MARVHLLSIFVASLLLGVSLLAFQSRLGYAQPPKASPAPESSVLDGWQELRFGMTPNQVYVASHGAFRGGRGNSDRSISGISA